MNNINKLLINAFKLANLRGFILDNENVIDEIIKHNNIKKFNNLVYKKKDYICKIVIFIDEDDNNIKEELPKLLKEATKKNKIIIISDIDPKKLSKINVDYFIELFSINEIIIYALDHILNPKMMKLSRKFNKLFDIEKMSIMNERDICSRLLGAKKGNIVVCYRNDSVNLPVTESIHFRIIM